MHAKQPSLPSIQSLLLDDSRLVSTITSQQHRGHRSTRSVGGELQHLSMYTETSPTTTPTPPPDTTAHMINSKTLSNMKRNSSQFYQPHSTMSPTLPSLNYSHAQTFTETDPPAPVGTRRKSTSIPYLSPSQLQTAPFAAVDSAVAAFNPYSPPRLQSTPMDQARPFYQHTIDTRPPSSTDQNHKQHRRAASATTVDYMLKKTLEKGLPINKSSSSSGSTSSNYNNNSYLTSHNIQNDDLGNKTTISTSSAASRYICTYCQKRFSRPSSLRIHTYSHSGEKPFICPEIGCGRRFSVQSNQRRHLRVHRLSQHRTNSALGGVM